MTDEETISRLKCADKSIYIYGNMNTARLVCRILMNNGIKPVAFIVDAFAFRGESVMDGLPVRCIDDIDDIVESNIVIGFDNVEKTRAMLSLGKYLVYNIWHIVSAGSFIDWSNNFYEKHKSELNVFRNSLADNKSQKVYDALVSAYLGKDTTSLLSVADSSQYFNELTYSANTESDVFVDCGAFDGDTIKKYVEFTGGRYKKIFAMEPLSENVEMLKENTRNIRNLNIIECGAWSCETNLSFKSDTSASSISETGDVVIKTATIDSLVNEERVTFIKMDIEGAEYEALCGAQKTIEKWHPKLAICVYHKSDDFIRIPAIIQSFKGANNYKFYLRHHSNRLSETVLYAIPG